MVARELCLKRPDPAHPEATRWLAGRSPRKMSTSIAVRPPLVENREQGTPTDDQQTGTLALPLGSTAAAAIIGHEVPDAGAFDADAKVTSLRIDAEQTTTPVCTNESDVYGHCDTVVAPAAMGTHTKRCSLLAISENVAMQAARSVASGDSCGLGPRDNETGVHRGQHVAEKAGGPKPRPTQRPCSPPPRSPTEPISPFSLPPRMPAVRLSANPKPLAAPCVLAFAASRRLGHEDSKPAEDEQASRAAIIHEEYAHMSADEDSSSSSSDESVAAKENSAAASLLTRTTFNEGRGRDGRPISKKRMKKHERLNGCGGSVETLQSPLWRMQTARAALPKVRGRSLFRI